MNRFGQYNHITQKDYQKLAGPDWPAWEQFVQHLAVPEFVYQELDEMLVRPIELEHNSFCVLPFYAREFWLGSKQPTVADTFCCLVPDGTDRSTVKELMLQGIRPEACDACWKLEDMGLISDRMIKNRNIDHDQLVGIQNLFAGQDQTSIRHYKIDGNNTCNGTCVVCDSTYSTAWANLQRTHGQLSKPSWQISTAKLDSQIDYATALSVGFRGGEPFLSENTWHVLEKLLEHNNTDCLISFTTNGSIVLNDQQKNLIARFTKVIFNFSIDGIGPVFEYVRYPLKWADLQRNLQYCRDNQILISASYTISNLNILYHKETTTWFDNHDIEYSLNPVQYPAHFRPSALPKTVKELIRHQHPNDPVISGLLRSHNMTDQNDYEIFLQKIAQQDRWKNIKMQNYLPELTEILG